MKLAVVGMGNLGTAVACLAASNGHRVVAWEYQQTVVDEINQQRRNRRYFGSRTIPDGVTATSDLNQVFNATAAVFVTLPSRFIEPVLSRYDGSPDAATGLVNMSKGINSESGETAFQTLCRLFPRQPAAMLAGPSLANEFSDGTVTALVAASSDMGLIGTIKDALENSHFAVCAGDDALGVELGGILKNCYALGMGMVDGSTASGLNFVGAYLTVALQEITTLGVALGASEGSFRAFSGVWDLIATAMSEHSHNRAMGRLVAKGIPLAEIEESMGVLPEGYNSLLLALRLAEEQAVKLPLVAVTK